MPQSPMVQDGVRATRSDGYVTFLRNILGGGSTPARLEKVLGFKPGHLGKGYFLLILAQGECITEGEFEYQGYSYMLAGVPLGEDMDMHTRYTQRPDNLPSDKVQNRQIMRNWVGMLNRAGLDRVAKVVPAPGAFAGYEPGAGAIQFNLTAAKRFDVVAKVAPGQALRRHANGSLSVVTA